MKATEAYKSGTIHPRVSIDLSLYLFIRAKKQRVAGISL